MTVCFFDPDGPHGWLIATPVTFDPKARLRPAFIIHRRDNPEAFNYYWNEYHLRFDDSTRTRDIEELSLWERLEVAAISWLKRSKLDSVVSTVSRKLAEKSTVKTNAGVPDTGSLSEAT